MRPRQQYVAPAGSLIKNPSGDKRHPSESCVQAGLSGSAGYKAKLLHLGLPHPAGSLPLLTPDLVGFS